MKQYNLDLIYENLTSSRDEMVLICKEILSGEINEDVESVIVSYSRDNEGFSPSQNAKEILDIASKLMEMIAMIDDAKVRNPYIEG